MKTIADRVRAIVISHATNGGHHALQQPLLDTHKFLSDLRMDSLDVTELTMSVEEEFHIRIPEFKPSNFKTPADVIAYVKSVLPDEPTGPVLAALPANKIAEIAKHVKDGDYATQIEVVTEIVRLTELAHSIPQAMHA